MITFKFDANQPFQLRAIRSVTGLFEQQRFANKNSFGGQSRVRMVSGTMVVPNILELDDFIILKNLNKIQQENGLDISKKLKSRDFSIEMETGTGKTYIYLRTILELYQQFGFRKFIIIVPSIAIREGVLKTLQMTRDHFEEIYNGVPYRYDVYQSKTLSKLRQFALSDSVEILIMTIDSFNKDSNVINNYTDRLAGSRPIDLIRETHPILILDEPQNMESDKARSALSSLNPLFTLRYSATHRHYYNLVYRLTPFDAYQMGLVKQIEVYSITETNDANQAFVSVDQIFRKNGKLLTKLSVNARHGRGGIKNKILQFKAGESLFSKTKLPVYENWVISEINLKQKSVQFTNGKKLRPGQLSGSDRQLIMEKQIEVAIREHLEKAKRMQPQGIKNLTLFFIDRVDNYFNENGWIRTFFEKRFAQIQKEFKEIKSKRAASVHSGYFSKKKTEKAMEQDREAFDLIMRDKERLLSLDEPIEFIFSHSALREGWDNPNIFNICTLNYSHSQIKKRQEIGRGIRLCVDQNGERIFDNDINRLTVIANENYVEYVSRLQTEYEEEYGRGVPQPKVHNASLRRRVMPKKDYQHNPHFPKIRDILSPQTIFEINLDNKSFQKKCVIEINEIKVNSPSLILTKAKAEIKSGKFKASEISKKRLSNQKIKNVEIARTVEEIQKETGLTRNTVVNILSDSTSLKALIINPMEYTLKAIEVIRTNLAHYINEGIFYKKLSSSINLKEFKDFEEYENQLLEVNKTVYPFIAYSSKRERNFITILESNNHVEFYIKISGWFSFDTPYGKYSPGWVLMLKKGSKSKVIVCDLALDSKNDPFIPLKRHCAERNFNSLGVKYIVICSLENLERRLSS